MKIILLLTSLLFLTISCHKGGKIPPIDNAVDLDGPIINDSSLVHPEHFLLSSAISNPTAQDLDKPVIICVHGFSATTFEWSEFRDFAKSDNSFYTSIVLMGGHGRDYTDFKVATWEDWQRPVIDEYNKLRVLGYNRISIVGSSTGAPIVLNMIRENKINLDVLHRFFMIDPIITPSNKLLTAVSVVGPILSYKESFFAPGEKGFWYRFTPYQALKQLNKLTKQERKKIEKGITLPGNTQLFVYKSISDGSADPSSAPIIKKGVKNSDGSEITVKMINSSLHVITRLKGRDNVTTEDIQNQQNTFNEIKGLL